MQNPSRGGLTAEAHESQAPKQALEAVQREQEGLKKQLADLQRTEADHLQTISEVCTRQVT